MNDKDLLLAFVAKALNMNANEVTALIYSEDGSEIKSNALDLLVQRQSENVARIKKTAEEGQLNAGHKKGYKEALEKLEGEIKDKFGITSQATGISLIDEVVQTVAGKPASKEITEDDVKKHKLYLDLSAKLQATEAATIAKVNEEVGKVKSEWKRNETMREVQGRALELLQARKPVLSKDPEKARRQQKLLLDELSQYEFDIQGEGTDKRYVVLKDGKVLEDNLGHAIAFDALVQNTGDKYYDFEQGDDRNSPGDPNKKGQPAGSNGQEKSNHGVTLRKPASQQEWFQQHEAIDKNPNLKPEEKSQLQIELKNLYRGEGVPQN